MGNKINAGWFSVDERPLFTIDDKGNWICTEDIDGDYESPKFPNPKVQLRTYNLFKETPKGYWIGYGSLNEGKLRSQGHWISKTSKKRFAYPTKKEALENFIKRNERQIKILEFNIWFCKAAISIAKAKINFVDSK